MKPRHSISYAIPVCNEHIEIEALLKQLDPFISDSDEIVIQCDRDNTTPEVSDVITAYDDMTKHDVVIIDYPLNGDFATFKNHLKDWCSKEYVFQIDADELLGSNLLRYSKTLIEANPEVDVFLLPRINIVNGLTAEYAASQRWSISDRKFPIFKKLGIDPQVINFPDRQARLFKNSDDISWVNKVHEELTGHKTISDLISGIQLPYNEIDISEIEKWSIMHIKDIDRQKRQNNLYQQIIQNHG